MLGKMATDVSRSIIQRSVLRKVMPKIAWRPELDETSVPESNSELSLTQLGARLVIKLYKELFH